MLSENYNQIAKYSSYDIEHTSSLVIIINLERADYENAFSFRDYTKQELEADYKHFILDFSNTCYLDSTFLGAIILFYKKITASGRSLNLILDSKKMTLLNVTQSFGTSLNIFTSVDEAVSSFVN